MKTKLRQDTKPQRNENNRDMKSQLTLFKWLNKHSNMNIKHTQKQRFSPYEV